MSRKAKQATRKRQRRPSRKPVPGRSSNPETPDSSAQSATDAIHDREIEIYRPSPEPAPGGSSDPECPALTGPDRKIVISRPGSPLTPRQQAVLPVLALSPSIAQAARDTGVSERTIRRWLDDPDFQEQLSQLHEASYDVARRQLQALVPHFLSVIAREAIENPDPALRVRAARYAMDYAVKFCDVDKIGDALRGLHDTLRDAG